MKLGIDMINEESDFQEIQDEQIENDQCKDDEVIFKNEDSTIEEQESSNAIRDLVLMQKESAKIRIDMKAKIISYYESKYEALKHNLRKTLEFISQVKNLEIKKYEEIKL